MEGEAKELLPPEATGQLWPEEPKHGYQKRGAVGIAHRSSWWWKGIAILSKTRGERTQNERTTEREAPASPKFGSGGSNSSPTKQDRTQCLKDPRTASKPDDDIASLQEGTLWAPETASTCCHVATPQYVLAS